MGTVLYQIVADRNSRLYVQRNVQPISCMQPGTRFHSERKELSKMRDRNQTLQKTHFGPASHDRHLPLPPAHFAQLASAGRPGAVPKPKKAFLPLPPRSVVASYTTITVFAGDGFAGDGFVGSWDSGILLFDGATIKITDLTETRGCVFKGTYNRYRVCNREPVSTQNAKSSQKCGGLTDTTGVTRVRFP